MVNIIIRKPVGDTNEINLSEGRLKNNLAAARREELFGDLQKSYLAVARRDELSGGHQKSYLACVRRVIWLPPEG